MSIYNDDDITVQNRHVGKEINHSELVFNVKSPSTRTGVDAYHLRADDCI